MSNIKRSKLPANIILPAVFTIILFVFVNFRIIIPYFESAMLQDKRETIRELTNAAHSILSEFEGQVNDSILSMEEAQKEAIFVIKNLRYGEEGKDYFWITDMHPNMIIHPYRLDLTGKNLSDYADPNGKKLFVEFVNEIKKSDDAYVDYMWQWKDDSSKIVPKLSYVKGFKPWGWIVGTGIYVEDVKEEIKNLTRRLMIISSVIALIVAAALFYFVRRNVVSDRKKSIADKKVRETNVKYRTLVEASTEGIIMLQENKNVYSNKYIQNFLGYTEDEFRNININNLLVSEDNTGIFLFEKYTHDDLEKDIPKNFEVKLRKKDGSTVDVFVSISKILMKKMPGLVIAIKDIRKHKKIEQELDETIEKLNSITNNIDIGIFRNTLGPKGKFIEANQSVVDLLGFKTKSELFNIYIFDLIHSKSEKKDIFNTLNSGSDVRKRNIKINKTDGTVFNAQVSLFLVKDENGKDIYCDGIIQDITAEKNIEKARESLIEELHIANLYMNRQVKTITGQAPVCNINTSIKNAVSLMNESQTNVIIICTEEDLPIGIVSDIDFRKRVICENLDYSEPVYKIMTSPIFSISQDTMLFEALLKMEEKKVNHLCVKDNEDKIIGIVRVNELAQAKHQTPAFLIQRIKKAKTYNELKKSFNLIPILLKAFIKSGANSKTINQINSKFSDEITTKVIDFVCKETKMPGADFSFITLGSVGRGEQTLLTDQDNALIYDDTGVKDKEKLKEEFLSFGASINEKLNYTGYNFCEGEIMARNPKWCLSLSEWKKLFTNWFKNPLLQELINFSVFFDFKHSFGNPELSLDLKNFAVKNEVKKDLFFYYLAQNIISLKPPINFFGNFVVESNKENKSFFDIKKVLLPITSIGRIYSLKHQITEINTLKRFDKLYEKGFFSQRQHKILTQTYNYLMLMRIKHQLIEIEKQKEPNNYIIPKDLTNIERTMLKKIFSDISDFQTKISLDFKGSMQ